MVKITEKLKRFALILAAVLLIPSNFGVSGGVYAAAETEGSDSAIMQELSTLTVGGEKFNAAEYPVNAEGSPQLLNLCEFGYGSTAETRYAYGLVLYVYNPAQLDIVQDQRNTVQMKIGGAERYSKYAISLIDWSADMLFYKFRVDFTNGEKSAALAALNGSERVYDVSSIEFYVEGFNATDYPISRAFTYTGYAAGEGEDSESTLTNTLSYTEAGGTEPIKIEVNHTSWRPEGTNGNSQYTQDTIHSIYFAVPKEHDEKYERLTSVKAHWLEARLAPVYVTANKDVYENLKKVIENNKDISALSWEDDGAIPYPQKFDYTGLEWALYAPDISKGTMNERAEIVFGTNVDLNGKIDNTYNNNSDPELNTQYDLYFKKRLESLTLVVYTGGSKASEYYVTPSEQERLIREACYLPDTPGLIGGGSETKFNDKLVANKYASYLFESWDTDFTTKTIKIGKATEEEKEDETIITEDKLNLRSENLRQKWWQYVFGGYTVENQQDYTGIDAIKEVTPEDIEGGADALYISANDFDDFKTFYEDNKNSATIYIMRYAVSETYSAKTYECEKVDDKMTAFNPHGETWSRYEGYFAQSNCYLGFDVLDFEYEKAGTSYVIPVSMSPIDIFTELPPPVEVGYYDFWKCAVIIVAVLTVFYIVYKIIDKAVRR